MLGSALALERELEDRRLGREAPLDAEGRRALPDCPPCGPRRLEAGFADEPDRDFDFFLAMG